MIIIFIKLVQLLICKVKFHMHKMKWSDSKPNFSNFKNDFKLYCNALQNCTSKKAIRACNIVCKYDCSLKFNFSLKYYLHIFLLLSYTLALVHSIFVLLFFSDLQWMILVLLFLVTALIIINNNNKTVCVYMFYSHFNG